MLPETEALSDADCRALHNYVQQGGKILATFKPGLFDDKHTRRNDFGLAETLGVNYVEEVTKYAGKDGPGIYLQTNGHPLSAFIGSGEVGILGQGVQPQKSFCTYVRVQGKAESIFDYKPPYLVPDVSKHLFHSWNVAPPGNDLIPMAATVNRCGRGTAVYIGVPIFRRYSPDLYWIADWVRGLITRLVPEPPGSSAGRAGCPRHFLPARPKAACRSPCQQPGVDGAWKLSSAAQCGNRGRSRPFQSTLGGAGVAREANSLAYHGKQMARTSTRS